MARTHQKNRHHLASLLACDLGIGAQGIFAPSGKNLD
jgi:hypothetical protein